LFDAAGLSAGQKVLIHAAAGGVGHFAVQLAKWKGAHVIGTASARNQNFLTELGADEAIDYEKTRFEDFVKDVDVVFDSIGGETRERSWKVLKKGGFLVAILGPASPEAAEAYAVRHAVIMVQPNFDQLTQISNLVDAGKLKVHVEKVFPLSEAAKAHELSATNRVRGKLVLQVI
jgi:NADPH:quinone reductase-like Zn-dependent oxidoreductase